MASSGTVSFFNKMVSLKTGKVFIPLSVIEVDKTWVDVIMDKHEWEKVFDWNERFELKSSNDIEDCYIKPVTIDTPDWYKTVAKGVLKVRFRKLDNFEIFKMHKEMRP